MERIIAYLEDFEQRAAAEIQRRKEYAALHAHEKTTLSQIFVVCRLLFTLSVGIYLMRWADRQEARLWDLDFRPVLRALAFVFDRIGIFVLTVVAKILNPIFKVCARLADNVQYCYESIRPYILQGRDFINEVRIYWRGNKHRFHYDNTIRPQIIKARDSLNQICGLFDQIRMYCRRAWIRYGGMFKGTVIGLVCVWLLHWWLSGKFLFWVREPEPAPRYYYLDETSEHGWNVPLWAQTAAKQQRETSEDPSHLHKDYQDVPWPGEKPRASAGPPVNPEPGQAWVERGECSYWNIRAGPPMETETVTVTETRWGQGNFSTQPVTVTLTERETHMAPRTTTVKETETRFLTNTETRTINAKALPQATITLTSTAIRGPMGSHENMNDSGSHATERVKRLIGGKKTWCRTCKQYHCCELPY